MRAASVDLSIICLCFVVLGHIAVFVNLWTPSLSVCEARIFLLPLAITGITLASALKVWKIYYICGNFSLKSNLAEGVSLKRMLIYMSTGTFPLTQA